MDNRPPFSASFTCDPNDYVCGRGVLLRCLSSAGSLNALRLLKISFDERFTKTAQAAWDHRDQNSNQFTADWNPRGKAKFVTDFEKAWGHGDGDMMWGITTIDPVLQAAGLDALCAAIRVYKP
jgi:hypothetical protein